MNSALPYKVFIQMSFIQTSLFQEIKINALKKELALWNSLVEKKDTTMFLNLNGYVLSVDITHKEVLNIVSQHLKQLAINFDHSFPADEDPRHGNLWMNDPFI